MTDMIPVDVLDELAAIEADHIAATAWSEVQTAMLGATISNQQIVKVPDTARQYPNQCYYTSLEGDRIGKVINTVAPYRYGLHVKIGYPPGDRTRMHVMSLASDPSENRSADEVGTVPHAMQHSLRAAGLFRNWDGKVGEDVVLFDARQAWNTNIQPWTGLTIYLTPGWVKFGGYMEYFPGEEYDLSAYQPGGTAYDGRFVLLELDRDMTVHATAGPVFYYGPAHAPYTDYLPAPDGNHFQLGYVALEATFDAVTWMHIWTGMQQSAMADMARQRQELDLELDELRTALAVHARF